MSYEELEKRVEDEYAQVRRDLQLPRDLAYAKEVGDAGLYERVSDELEQLKRGENDD